MASGDPRQRYLGEQLTHAVLQRRQRAVADQHTKAVEQVAGLLDTQRDLGGELTEALATLRVQRTELDRMSQGSDASLLASLVRPFTARRAALARRSIAEGLLAKYEHVSLRLRQATTFSDELKLCALELQQQVDLLHCERTEALQNQRTAAQRLIALEAEFEALSVGRLTPEERARERDRIEFDRRTEAVALDLYQAAAELGEQHLPAARALRDTVLRLHEEMASFVLGATHTVNAAGRRIQGLGMLADAPTVVRELQESLDELNGAMVATADYVVRSQTLIAEVLPTLSARVQSVAEATEFALQRELVAADREKSRLQAERALREAAVLEIDQLLSGD